MYDEVKNHPGKLAIEVGIGAAIAVGSICVLPEIAVGVAIVGTVGGAYELGKGIVHLADEAKVIDNADQK
jgi:hypothetical protein